MFKVRDKTTGKFLDRVGKIKFSNVGDFFRILTVARNQKDRALAYNDSLPQAAQLNLDLEIVGFNCIESFII